MVILTSTSLERSLRSRSAELSAAELTPPSRGTSQRRSQLAPLLLLMPLAATGYQTPAMTRRHRFLLQAAQAHAGQTGCALLGLAAYLLIRGAL